MGNLHWDTFQQTGSIEAYLAYRAFTEANALYEDKMNGAQNNKRKTYNKLYGEEKPDQRFE